MAEFACNCCEIELTHKRFKCLTCFDFDLCEQCCLNVNNVDIQGHCVSSHILVKLDIIQDSNTKSFQHEDGIAGIAWTLHEELSVLDSMGLHYMGGKHFTSI